MWTKNDIKNKAGKLAENLNTEAHDFAERVSVTIQKKTGVARRKTGAAFVKVGKAIARKS